MTVIRSTTGKWIRIHPSHSGDTVKGLATRLAKAEELVAAGAVAPVAGMDGFAVVKNGDGSQFYLVEYTNGREQCSCPDYQQRQKAAGPPCKHVLSAQLMAQGTTPEPPTPVAAPVDLTPGIDLLMGKAA